METLGSVVGTEPRLLFWSACAVRLRPTKSKIRMTRYVKTQSPDEVSEEESFESYRKRWKKRIGGVFFFRGQTQFKNEPPWLQPTSFFSTSVRFNASKTGEMLQVRKSGNWDLNLAAAKKDKTG